MATRLIFLLTLFTAFTLSAKTIALPVSPHKSVMVTETGAVGDGKTTNTQAIQAAIDQCATCGGGTVEIPKGEFVSGAVVLKPGVNLKLAEGAVLRASALIDDFPAEPHVRFEGHFAAHAASLLNVDHCDHFRLSGPGVLDGSGAAYWKNSYPAGMPRLCEICNSKAVVVSGVRFTNSPQWNLHFYNCQDCLTEDCRFEISPKAKGPSTDGTDIDSSENITVKRCYYSVNDDCICLKGNRYDGLNQVPQSLPVKHIQIMDCTFARGMGALSLGTEATILRDVEFKNSTVLGNMPMLRIKLRPDTVGQDYSDIRVHDLRLNGRGRILSLESMHGTKVASGAAAHGKVSRVTVENITGNFGSFGHFSGANTEVRDITLRNFDVAVAGPTNLIADQVVNLKMENVKVSSRGML